MWSMMGVEEWGWAGFAFNVCHLVRDFPRVVAPGRDHCRVAASRTASFADDERRRVERGAYLDSAQRVSARGRRWIPMRKAFQCL